MSSLGTSKGILEIAKFAVYVSVPIGLMYFFANNTGNLQKVINNVRIYIIICVYLKILTVYVVCVMGLVDFVLLNWTNKNRFKLIWQSAFYFTNSKKKKLFGQSGNWNLIEHDQYAKLVVFILLSSYIWGEKSFVPNRFAAGYMNPISPSLLDLLKDPI